MRLRFSWMIGFAAASAVACAQTWMTSYEEGLGRARKGEWAAAREAFKQAVAYRTEDQARPTNLPGPATERRIWRNGAAYSPNFLAAYSGYRNALTIEDPEKKALLTTVATEFEALLTKGQVSAETYFFLNSIYVATGDTNARMKLDDRMQQAAGKMTWKVDTEPVSPEEMALVNQLARANIDNPGTVDMTNSGATTPNNTNPTLPSVSGARVPTIGSKFALIIGNSESRIANAAVPFAVNDAQIVREALLANAGYAEPNVDLVMNSTADGIKNAVKALADRIPDGATVFIYFTGVGVNLGGKDYIAGVDTESATDSSTMVAKSDIYQMLMTKGARIFAFYQSSRTIANGRYFGMEVPLVGAISQCQATIPGEQIQSLMKGGSQRGLYTDALVGALGEIRSNRIPIQEFGWQIFYRMRRGDAGSVGGGSKQTPTLPVLTNLGSDARF